MNVSNETGSVATVHDGFPNPATDSRLQTLDLNKLLVKQRVSTYFMRAHGDDWHAYGIFAGDLLIIDRALRPRPNDLMVWWAGENFCLGPRHAVPPDTPTFGVVSGSIHQFRG